MVKINRIVFSILSIIILLLCCILIPLIYFTSNPIVEEPIYLDFTYPEPLYNKCTFSDMVVEDDNTIHFSIMSYRSSSLGPTYAFLNLEDESNHSLSSELIEDLFSGDDRDLRIFLDLNKEPLVYWYRDDGMISLVGTYFVPEENSWSIPDFYDNTTTRRMMDRLLNLYYDESNKLVIASITWGAVITPSIYYEESNNFHLLNKTFPQLDDKKALYPGDLKNNYNKTALIWWNYNVTSYFPILTVNWEDESWSIYELGDNMTHYYPLSVFINDKCVKAIFYDDGKQSGNARLFSALIYNSSYYEIKQIAEFEGIVEFGQDSICELPDDTLALFYSKFENSTENQSDLFLGLYNGTSFLEHQLTYTNNLYERWANCDLSENYIHYLWTVTPGYYSNQYYIGDCILYYNRLLLDTIYDDNITVNSTKIIKSNVRKLLEEFSVVKSIYSTPIGQYSNMIFCAMIIHSTKSNIVRNEIY